MCTRLYMKVKTVSIQSADSHRETLTEINFYPFHEFLSRKHRKILKKHITFSKNIMEIGRLQYHFSKIDFRGKPLTNIATGVSLVIRGLSM